VLLHWVFAEVVVDGLSLLFLCPGPSLLPCSADALDAAGPAKQKPGERRRRSLVERFGAERLAVNHVGYRGKCAPPAISETAPGCGSLLLAASTCNDATWNSHTAAPISFEITLDMNDRSTKATVRWRCSPSGTPTSSTIDLGVAAHATADAIVTVVPWQLQNRFALRRSCAWLLPPAECPPSASMLDVMRHTGMWRVGRKKRRAGSG
jgi:hypothetical protein